MKEADLRKWHRTLGIVLAFFMILQAGSGVLLSLGDMDDPLGHAFARHGDRPEAERGDRGIDRDGDDDIVELIHHGAGGFGAAYRILLGVGMLAMAFSGSLIYLKIRARTPQKA